MVSLLVGNERNFKCLNIILSIIIKKSESRSKYFMNDLFFSDLGHLHGISEDHHGLELFVQG